MLKCKEYERLWVNSETNDGWCVDAHLTDFWLVSLNRLKTLALKSICEGHLGATGSSQQDHPFLRFRLRSQFIPILRANADDFSRFIHASIQSSITNVRSGWWELEPDVFFIDLDSKEKRKSKEMESWVADWFNDALLRLQIVDGRMIQYET